MDTLPRDNAFKYFILSMKFMRLRPRKVVTALKVWTRPLLKKIREKITRGKRVENIFSFTSEKQLYHGQYLKILTSIKRIALTSSGQYFLISVNILRYCPHKQLV